MARPAPTRAQAATHSADTYDLREIVRRQTLPGYRLVIESGLRGDERLNFTPIPVDPLAAALRRGGLATTPVDKL